MGRYKYEKTFTFEGKRYHIYGNTIGEVTEKMANKKIALREQSKDLALGMTVRDWTEECIELYKSGQSDITRRKYEQRVEHCILEHIGAMRLKDVTRAQCQQVVNRTAGMSKAHINEVYRALKFIFSHAYIDGLIVKDPTLGIVKPKGTYKPRRALTPMERELVLSIAPEERKYYGYLLMLLCGCRTSEAARATGRDLCSRDRYNMLHIQGTKTLLSDRYVPVPDELFDIIKGTPKDERIALYPSGRPMDDGNGSHLWHGFWYKMNKEAGAEMYRNEIITPVIGKDLVPYCLRHEYCSDLARKGIDLRVAQRLMGHSTITLTANIYTHVQDETILASAELLGATKSTTQNTTP